MHNLASMLYQLCFCRRPRYTPGDMHSTFVPSYLVVLITAVAPCTTYTDGKIDTYNFTGVNAGTYAASSQECTGAGGVVVGGTCGLLCNNVADYAKFLYLGHTQFIGDATSGGTRGDTPGVVCSYYFDGSTLQDVCRISAVAVCCVPGI